MWSVNALSRMFSFFARLAFFAGSTIALVSPAAPCQSSTVALAGSNVGGSWIKRRKDRRAVGPAGTPCQGSDSAGIRRRNGVYGWHDGRPSLRGRHRNPANG